MDCTCGDASQQLQAWSAASTNPKRSTPTINHQRRLKSNSSSVQRAPTPCDVTVKGGGYLQAPSEVRSGREPQGPNGRSTLSLDSVSQLRPSITNRRSEFVRRHPFEFGRDIATPVNFLNGAKTVLGTTTAHLQIPMKQCRHERSPVGHHQLFPWLDCCNAMTRHGYRDFVGQLAAARPAKSKRCIADAPPSGCFHIVGKQYWSLAMRAAVLQ